METKKIYKAIVWELPRGIRRWEVIYTSGKYEGQRVRNCILDVNFHTPLQYQHEEIRTRLLNMADRLFE